MEIKNRIEEVRERQGLTTYALAQIARIDRGGLKNIEEGKTMPKLDTAIKICQALNIHFFDLWIVGKEYESVIPEVRTWELLRNSEDQ